MVTTYWLWFSLNPWLLYWRLKNILLLLHNPSLRIFFYLSASLACGLNHLTNSLCNPVFTRMYLYTKQLFFLMWSYGFVYNYIHPVMLVYMHAVHAFSFSSIYLNAMIKRPLKNYPLRITSHARHRIIK